MAIAFRAAGTVTNATASGSTTVTVPASVVANDVLLFVVGISNNLLQCGNFTDPSGWTLIATVENTNSNNLVRVYRKLAVGTEASTNITCSWDGTTTRNTGSILAYSGCRNSNYLNASNTGTKVGSPSTSVTGTTVTSTVADCSIVQIVQDKQANGDQAWTSPTNYTERVDLNAGINSSRSSQSVADRHLQPAGVNGGGTWTTAFATGSVSMLTLALAPAIAPNAPTIGTATAGNAQASVAFSAPADNGGATITGYTATSSPGGFTGTGAASPITVTGLTNGVAYTFTVTATNAQGTSAASAASNSVTPAAGSPGVAGDNLARSLNRLAGTTGLTATNAANVWAGTSNKTLVDALNIKAGNTLPNYKALGGVCNQLASTSNLSPLDALRQIIA